MSKETALPQGLIQAAASEKEKKLQFVQYECIKSELKEEYDKRVGFLHKRLNKKAQMDPSFLLLNDMTTQPMTTKNNATKADILTNPTGMITGERNKQIGQQIQLQKKILGGPK